MDICKHLLFVFVGSLAFPSVNQAQDQTGFISLDCGLPADISYSEPTSTLHYTSDAAYINSGVSKNLSSNYQEKNTRQYRRVRSFPEGLRNCYNISIKKGIKYLMRANFLYGNYDGLSILPEFNLYLGNSLWRTVKITDESIETTTDVIYVTTNNQLQICLVNIGKGAPFISSLEFRPLPNKTYEILSGSLLLSYRLDSGTTTNKTYRFPDDIYDRYWMPFIWDEGTSINTTLPIDVDSNNFYQPGSAVMGTAAIQKNTSKTFYIRWVSENENTQYYVYMHFSEVLNLQGNQTRGFNIFYNGSYWDGPLVPKYLSTSTFAHRGPLPVPAKEHLFSLKRTGDSTLPPIINAIEIYSVIDITELTSDQGDVDAIKKIKSTYGIIRDWEGDPCLPRAYPWTGISCTDETNPRILTLNLSSSGLTGQISTSISYLEMIQTLDLSNNGLTGNIPDFLANLSNLKILMLDNNKLKGSIPSELIMKSNDGPLLISVEGNPDLDIRALNDSREKKDLVKKLLPLIVAAPVAGFVAIVVIATWFVKPRYKRRNVGVLMMEHSGINIQISDLLKTKRRKFTYSEVLKMTNNFERILGKGGFGMVYYGVIDNTQVAVKLLSQATSQGYQQFQAEVTLLFRVHHKNLTNLVGYLNEGDRLGLIYEFMAKGNLAENLLVNTSGVLSWQDRLQIAVGAAQGLEYLHDGCKPPIIHRDVKTTNILLTENFEAKLADFGLSKSFPTEGNNSYISTVVAGTPGYLDPEYYRSNRLTEKSDVYGFGVALMEIISCRAVISRTEKNAHISEWVKSMVAQEDVNGIVDPRLNRKYDVDSVRKVVEIAVKCVSEDSGKRPTMRKVVGGLKKSLDMELGRLPGNRASDPTNSMDIMSVGTNDSESDPMAR